MTSGRDLDSVSSSRTHLRLVSTEEDRSPKVFVDESALHSTNFDALIAEAEAIEAWYGNNAYSGFIKKYRRRPNRNQAATIGRLLGARVAADDGSMQPPLTKADRAVLRGIKSRRKAASRRYDHILRLRDAIAALSKNEDDPAEVIGTGSCLLDEPAISAQLDSALCWLSQFAKEWRCRGEKTGTNSEESVGRG